MNQQLLNSRDIDFLLYDLLDTANSVAQKYFANITPKGMLTNQASMAKKYR